MQYVDEFKLNFKDSDDAQSLYDDVDFEANDIVDAQYRRVVGYEGKPDICSLPEARDLDTINREHYIIPPELIAFRNGKYTPKTKAEWMALIASQRRIRVPFPYHEELEVTISALLKEVYINRKMSIETREINIECEGGTQKLACRSMVPQIIPNPPGFCLLATSGHGKSAAVELVSRHIPNAIRHEGYIQIPILYLTAFGNKNVTELLKSAARKLDQILDAGNAYRKQIEKMKSPAEIAEQLVVWIQTFHIGMIIIDEVQYLEFGKYEDSGSGKNTFANIIHVTEESGVALGVIGNIDAMTNWRKVLRDMRRLEEHKIYVEKLSGVDNALTFEIIKLYWKYQVFSKRVPLTDSIAETLAKECHGSIDLLVLIMMAVEYNVLFSKEEAKVTHKLIEKVARKHFSKMQALIDNDDAKSDLEYCSIRKSIEDEMQQTYQEVLKAQSEKAVSDSLLSMEQTNRYEEVQTIFDNIAKCLPDTTKKSVEKAYNTLSKSSKGFESLDIETKTSYVFRVVQAAKYTRNRRSKQMEQILESLEKQWRSDDTA